MPLAGFEPESREVAIARGVTVRIRGLSLSSIAVLIREHFPDLDAIVDLIQSNGSFDIAELQPLAVAVVSQAPGLAANIIALAAGEGTARDAERIPGPTQISLLKEIAELTFAEAGGVGKAWETIAALLKTTKMREALTKFKTTD